MGFFDFFTKKRKQHGVTHPSNNDTVNRQPMSFQERFNLMEARRENFFHNPERSPLIEIATIISHGNPQVVADFTLLVDDPDAFYRANQEWFDEYLGDFSQDRDILSCTAYWLVGYYTDFTYGAFIDWKEGTDEVLSSLNEALKKLNYPMDLGKIIFSGEEYTYMALAKINEYMREMGYTLTTLDTYSDSYHLFIIPTEKYPQLCALGNAIGLEFSDDYSE